MVSSISMWFIEIKIYYLNSDLFVFSFNFFELILNENYLYFNYFIRI